MDSTISCRCHGCGNFFPFLSLTFYPMNGDQFGFCDNCLPWAGTYSPEYALINDYR